MPPSPHKGEIGFLGPQRAKRGCPGALSKTLENREIRQRLGSGRVWGEPGTPKHLQDTIQSIWVVGFLPNLVLGSIPTQNNFSRGLFLGPNLPGPCPAQVLGPNFGSGVQKWVPGSKNKKDARRKTMQNPGLRLAMVPYGASYAQKPLWGSQAPFWGPFSKQKLPKCCKGHQKVTSRNLLHVQRALHEMVQTGCCSPRVSRARGQDDGS